MISDKFQLGLKVSIFRGVIATVMIFLALCPLHLSAEQSEAKKVEILLDKLNTNGLREFYSTVKAENIELPAIPSEWHIEHIMNQERRPNAKLWRDLGREIVNELSKEARILQEPASIQQYESRVLFLIDLAEWCTQKEGYGNVMLGRQCLDLASVGFAKLLVNPDYPQDSCDQTMARLTNFKFDREVGRRILNQEAGSEVFPPGLNEEEMQRVWGNGRILWRARLNHSKNLKRTYPMPSETPQISQNLPYFGDLDWPASVARTSQSTWDVKWHGRIVMGLQLQNVERVKALAMFRKAVGSFPKERDSGDELRPGPEGVFYKAWLTNSAEPVGMDLAQREQNRKIGFAAWAAYDRVQRGIFVDEDTEAIALQTTTDK